LRKILHGIHRLEERLIEMEGRQAAEHTLRPVPAGSRVYNDSIGTSSWIPPLSVKPQRG
jgi:hypothetical protein